ncbi:ife-1 [Nucleospora cyclopteri]
MEESACKWKFLQQSNKVNAMTNWADSFTAVGEVTNAAELNYVLDKLREEKLESLNDLYFFKDDLKPVWEDEANLEGGRLVFEINHKNLKTHDLFDKSAALCFSGLFNSINGLVFNEKERSNRFCIWVGGNNELEDIEAAWKEVLESAFARFIYIPHKKSNEGRFGKKRNGGFGKKNQ